MSRPSPRLTLSRWLLPAIFALAVLGSVRPARATEAGLELETPRRALQEFLNASGNADHARAAAVLDLRRLAPQARAQQGPLLARQLRLVLDRGLWIAPEDVSDLPNGDPKDGATIDELGAIASGGKSTPITMSQVTRPDGRRVWLFSAPVVAQIPKLHDAYANRWLDRLPTSLVDIYFRDLALWQWLGLALLALASVALGAAVWWLLAHALQRLVRRTAVLWDDDLFELLRGPFRVLTMALVFRGSLPALELIPPAQESVDKALILLLIATFGWIATRSVRVITRVLERQAERRASERDDGRVRGVRTQMLVLQRIFNIVTGVLSIALMLMQFEAVKSVGVSVLASAGVVGIVLGLAAQKPMTALLAGLQMSVTQPIRIGDAVVVQNEFGTIEEIKLSLVIVRLWDERRLIVPTTYFLDNTFQNWTRGSPALTGQVLIAADFALPVAAMRAALDRLLENESLWDRRVKELAVTDATENTMQLRALVSAGDAGRLFNLRCRVREGLIAWLREYNGGHFLPRRRWESEPTRSREERRISSAEVRTS